MLKQRNPQFLIRREKRVLQSRLKVRSCFQRADLIVFQRMNRFVHDEVRRV